MFENSKSVRLVDAVGLLAALFEPESRPSLRWLREQQKRRTVPFVKVGHLVFFNVDQVRAALDKAHTVKARGA